MGLGKWSDSEVNPLVKYFLFFFNFLLWVISFGFVIVGVWAYLEKSKFDTGPAKIDGKDVDFYDIAFDLSIIIIILGCVMFVFTFIGCVGAIRENYTFLKIFCILVSVLFLAEVISAILAFIFSSEIESKATEVLKKQGIPRYMDGDLDWDNFVNWVQETFKCCGINDLGYHDWSNNPYFNCTPTNRSPQKCGVPFSCCINQTNIVLNQKIINIMCGYGTQDLSIPEASKVIFTKGCLQGIKDLAESNLYIIGGVILGLAIPQLICIFLSWCLMTQVKNTI